MGCDLLLSTCTIGEIADYYIPHLCFDQKFCMIVHNLVSMLSTSLGIIVGGPNPLYVMNLSAVAPNLLPLFLSAQGTLSRLDLARVMTVGLDDSGPMQLQFLQTQYNFSDAVELEPWSIFSLPEVQGNLAVVLCDVQDSSLGLHAALTLASVHGQAVATCVNSTQRRQV